MESKRQVVEIPPVKPIIEYQSFSKTCSCGHKQIGEYPEGISNHIQYGTSIEAIIGYQYTPFKRLSAKAQPLYQTIKENIENSRQVGGDETGAK